jgi:hypothetical protein
MKIDTLDANFGEIPENSKFVAEPLPGSTQEGFLTAVIQIHHCRRSDYSIVSCFEIVNFDGVSTATRRSQSLTEQYEVQSMFLAFFQDTAVLVHQHTLLLTQGTVSQQWA